MNYEPEVGLEVCPYDRNHIIRQNRMPHHLLRCERRHLNSVMLPCLYNFRHRIESDQYEEHLLSCQDRFRFGDIDYAVPVEYRNQRGHHVNFHNNERYLRFREMGRDGRACYGEMNQLRRDSALSLGRGRGGRLQYELTIRFEQFHIDQAMPSRRRQGRNPNQQGNYFKRDTNRFIPRRNSYYTNNHSANDDMFFHAEANQLNFDVGDRANLNPFRAGVNNPFSNENNSVGNKRIARKDFLQRQSSHNRGGSRSFSE